MINFSNLKCVLFDFDDTLCIHSLHDDFTFSVEDLEVELLANRYNWEDCKPNKHMTLFLHACKNRGMRLGLISHVFTAHSSLKKKRCHNLLS